MKTTVCCAARGGLFELEFSDNEAYALFSDMSESDRWRYIAIVKPEYREYLKDNEGSLEWYRPRNKLL